jgi:transcriptional regulator with XRE-family HTH domain
MNKSKTSEEWERELGAHLRTLRLSKNIDQRQLSIQAGIALNAVKNLESGKGATISSLVKTLRSLGRIEWLSSLAPEVSISPMQMIKARPQRQRASKHREGRDV